MRRGFGECARGALEVVEPDDDDDDVDDDDDKCLLRSDVGILGST